MQEIKVEKSRLLTTLQENKTKHEEAAKEATEAFYAKFKQLLTQVTDEVNQGLKFDEALRKLNAESPPRAHGDDYERQIKMLEYDTRDEIDLTPEEFARFVLDEWRWREEFAGSYMSNTGKAYR